jgi:hypothetical protein
MGTRGVFGFKIDGKNKLTYNHSDSYPDGLGADLVDEMKGMDLKWLKTKAKKIRLVDEDSKPTKKDKARLKEFSNLAVSTGTDDDWYCLLRDCQGSIMRTVEAGVMLDYNSFFSDTEASCQWAYVIDFDDNTFKIHRYDYDQRRQALVKSYPLDAIPDGWLQEVQAATADE